MRAALAALLLAAAPAAALRYDVTRERASNGRDVNVIRAAGLIENTDPAAWADALSRRDPDLDTLMILSSPGGSIPGGFMLLGRVDELQKSDAARGRRVAALAAGDCASMCVPVYFAFDLRLALPDARLGLHAASIGRFGFDREGTDLYLTRMKDKAAERGDALTPRFLAEQASAGTFSSTELVFFAAEDLAARATGLIPAGAVVDGVRAALDRLEAPR